MQSYSSEAQSKRARKRWTKTPEERFWSKVNKTETCWLWTGGRSGGGYGAFRDINSEMIGAHQFSYKTFVGPIADGHIVCHKCDVRLCVRPDHLFSGTYSDNANDMVSKDRHAKAHAVDQRGAANNGSKITESDAITVKTLHVQGKSQVEIARITGVKRANVWAIVHGKSWTHVQPAA